MTVCSGGPAEEMAALYLAGELTEPESEEFENHYLGCDPCHRMVMTLQAVQAELAQQPVSIPAIVPRGETGNAASGSGKVLRFPASFGGRMLAFGSLAAALLVAVFLTGSVLNRRGISTSTASSDKAPLPTVAKNEIPSSSPQSNALPFGSATLADLNLPAYNAPQLRDADSSDASHLAFTKGMAQYAKRDCAAALPYLTGVAFSSADGPSATLYAGLCELKAHSADKAQAAFSKIIAAGDSPQFETAQYYLAQSRLLNNDQGGAHKSLVAVVALHGDYEARAKAQLQSIWGATR